MPYRVEANEEEKDFTVLYFFKWDKNASAQVAWAATEQEAQAQCDRLNELESIVTQRFDFALSEIRDVLKESGLTDDEVVKLIEGWVVEKREYLNQGIF
jgi:hypothetical protein